jgi:hypothetical protein
LLLVKRSLLGVESAEMHNLGNPMGRDGCGKMPEARAILGCWWLTISNDVVR